MEWKQQLENLFNDNSRDFLVHSLVQKPGEIPNILKIIEEDEEKPAWRAAWVIDHLNQQKPQMVTPHLQSINRILKRTKYNGARRSLLKILVINPTNVNHDGELVDLCFQWVCSPAIPIAVRAYAMQFVYDMLPVYPELKNELKTSLETAIHDSSKGVRGKAKKILTMLEGPPKSPQGGLVT